MTRRLVSTLLCALFLALPLGAPAGATECWEVLQVKHCI